MPAQASSPATLTVAILGLVVGAFLAVALWRAGSGLKEQACIAEVEARYPAVPVSAFNTRTTGALKVSFVTERQRALNDC